MQLNLLKTNFIKKVYKMKNLKIIYKQIETDAGEIERRLDEAYFLVFEEIARRVRRKDDKQFLSIKEILPRWKEWKKKQWKIEKNGEVKGGER